MYAIEIYVQCPVEHNELSADAVSSELLVENIVSQALLEVFEAVYVTKVIVRVIKGKYDDISIF
ncbi:MAG: hypothetical protein ABI396_10980 [Ktedonobacteraceae bacterium]